MLERLGFRSAGVAAPRLSALAGVACALLLTLPASAAEESARLAGRIVDATGAVLSGVTVVVQSGAVSRETVTDAEGRFAFERLPPGKSSVRVALAGFEPAQVATTLVPGANEVGEVRLRAGRAEEVTVEGYITAASTKTDTPLRDLPQSIQVITAAVIEEQKPQRVTDAVANVSGVSKGYGLGGTTDSFAIRGFEPNFQFGGIYKNGTPARFNTAFEEPANIERIEVLKGPTSALYGQAGLAGFVNLVMKRPAPQRRQELELKAGSYQYLHGSLDVTGPVDRGNTLLYRLVGAYEDSGSFREFVETQRFFVAPSVSWLPSGRTTLTLYGEYGDQERDYDFGIPLVNGRIIEVPQGRNYSEPWSGVEFSVLRLGYELAQALRGSWSLNSSLRYQRSEEKDVLVLPAAPRGPEVLGRSANALLQRPDTADLSVNLLGGLATGSVTHKLLLGADVFWQEDEFQFLPGQTRPISLFAPVHDAVMPSYPPFAEDAERPSTTTLGIFAQDQVDLSSKVKVLAGARYNRERGTALFRIADDEAVTPRLGLVYQPTGSVALYVGYSTSYLSNTVFGRTIDGRPFRPQRGTQYEAGVKADALNNRVTLTAAVYDLRKTNVPTPDPDNPGFSLLIGEEGSKGLELDLSARITDSWRVLAVYAYTDATVVRSNVIPEGNQLPNFPKHSSRLWTTYRVPSGPLRDLGFGAGLIYQGERHGNVANTFTLGAYTIADAVVFYERPRWRVSLNVKNAFDNDYFEVGSFLVTAIPGAPRTVLASIAVRP